MAYTFGETTVTETSIPFECDNCGTCVGKKYTTPVTHDSMWTGSTSHTIATLCKNCHLY